MSSDGWAFQFENPQIADLLANIGAVLHRHDAHAAMANPSSAPTLAVIATGGALPSSTTIYIQYTLTDGQGGESLPTTVGTVATPAGYADPTSAPTAVVSTSAGTMLASTPMYAVSVTDGLGGETALGPPESVTVPPAPNAEVTISGLTAITNTSSSSASGAGWRLWRSVDGGNEWDLMSTGPHTTDTWLDDGSTAGDCSVNPLDTGTTGDTGLLHVTVPGGQPAAATFFSIYGSTDGSFVTPCLLGTYPIADAGSVKSYTTLSVLAGQPPRVSRCYGGANKIDPDTDILNWPWKQTVATVGALPVIGNTDGDARVVLSDYSLHVWNAGSSSWSVISGSGTSGVASVTAGDTSVVVGGIPTAPTIETATLDVIAADHPPAANWSNNSKKITSLADPTNAQDAATKTYVDTHSGTGGAGNTTTTEVVAGSLGSAYTLNLATPASPTIFLVTGTLNANCTLTISNRIAGCQVYLLLTQDGVGGHTLSISDGGSTQPVTIPTSPSALFGVLCVCPNSSDIDVVPLSVPGPTGPAGGTVTVTDGSTTETGVSEINITSGGTVSSGGAGIADVAIGGSSGGASLQNGVTNSGDTAISAISLNTGTGALTFTLASGALYVLSAGGVLTAVTYAGGSSTITPSLPASTKYAVIGVEISTAGAITLVKGTDTATQLNTASLIASNTPATSSGKLRLFDFAIWNNAGTYNFSDHTTTATQGVNWVDRRPWARGAQWTNYVGTASLAFTLGSFQNVDTSNFQARVECAGVPVRVRMFGTLKLGEATIAVSIDNDIAVGGAFGSPPRNNAQVHQATTNFFHGGAIYDWTVTGLAAGSHLFTMMIYANATPVNVGIGSPAGAGLLIEESVRQNANNGTV